jgi:hypothetical protein
MVLSINVSIFLQSLVTETPCYVSVYHESLSCHCIIESRKLKDRDIWIHKPPSNMLPLALFFG